jgi:hypothetical protein
LSAAAAQATNQQTILAIGVVVGEAAAAAATSATTSLTARTAERWDKHWDTAKADSKGAIRVFNTVDPDTFMRVATCWDHPFGYITR